MPLPKTIKSDDSKSSTEELVAFNKSLLKENRELRDENARLIRELERNRKKIQEIELRPRRDTTE